MTEGEAEVASTMPADLDALPGCARYGSYGG